MDAVQSVEDEHGEGAQELPDPAGMMVTNTMGRTGMRTTYDLDYYAYGYLRRSAPFFMSL